jgi:hypothetical protein
MSWEQLLAVTAQNVADIRTFQEQRPMACPNDGEPLSVSPSGQLYCPCGDWREGDSRTPVNAAN